MNKLTHLAFILTIVAVLGLTTNISTAFSDLRFGDSLILSLKESSPWKINPCLRKQAKVGQDFQDKVCTVYKIALAKGLTPHQIKYGIIGLVDHESAGTWSPTVKGDNGCSTGLGQWNACPGSRRKAGKDFIAQAHQIVDEMADKIAKHPLRLAICLHNSPAGRCNKGYVDLVVEAGNQFR